MKVFSIEVHVWVFQGRNGQLVFCFLWMKIVQCCVPEQFSCTCAAGNYHQIGFLQSGRHMIKFKKSVVKPFVVILWVFNASIIRKLSSIKIRDGAKKKYELSEL